jgi:OOP family OmpA-OmpF porin
MRNTLLTLIALALLATPAAAAEKNGFSLGAGISSSTIGVEGMYDELDTGDFEESDTGFKVFGGFRFLTFVGIEAGYVDFGSPTDSTGSGDSVQDIEVSLSGYDVAAVGYLPLGPVDIFAKAGMFWWNADVQEMLEQYSSDDLDSGSDPFYGIGVGVWLGHFNIRAEYELFDVEGTKDVNQVSLGFSYTF